VAGCISLRAGLLLAVGLEETYRKPLTEIVGVVTPFNAQVRAITHACRKLGIAAGAQRGDMIVGTVHSL
jgi:hypothetical protein